MKSRALSKSPELSLPSCGVMSRSSPADMLAIERCTFCSVRMLIICAVRPISEFSVSRPPTGVPTLTAISRVAPISRATSTGRLLTRPPSPRMRSSHSTGANTPGTLMLERSASARSPSARMRSWPFSMSVATARKGVGRRSNWRTLRTGSVSRRSSASRPRLDRVPVGTRTSPSRRPNSIVAENSKSSSLRRCDRSCRSTRLAKSRSQAILDSSRSRSSADMPLA